MRGQRVSIPTFFYFSLNLWSVRSHQQSKFDFSAEIHFSPSPFLSCSVIFCIVGIEITSQTCNQFCGACKGVSSIQIQCKTKVKFKNLSLVTHFENTIRYLYQKSKPTSSAVFDDAQFQFDAVQSSDELMIELYKASFLGSASLLGAAVVPVARFLLCTAP
jgi:hypothetical protein